MYRLVSYYPRTRDAEHCLLHEKIVHSTSRLPSEIRAAELSRSRMFRLTFLSFDLSLNTLEIIRDAVKYI